VGDDQEAGITPARPPTASVFLLAHHDDEVFCAAHLRRRLAGGGDVALVWVTAGGLAPARWRLAEGRRVRAFLGLQEGEALDLALPDRHAIDHLPRIEREVERLLTRLPSQTELFVPAWEGGHPDHDALNAVAARLAARHPGLRVFEFPLYARRGFSMAVQDLPSAPAPATETRLSAQLDAADHTFRWRLARANASQLLVSLLPLLAIVRLSGRHEVETVRSLPERDYRRPPGPRPLLYELYTGTSFGRVAGAVTRYLA
jgi:LmbE family N-acetylglucosaminyl deacetylase